MTASIMERELDANQSDKTIGDYRQLFASLGISVESLQVDVADVEKLNRDEIKSVLVAWQAMHPERPLGREFDELLKRL